MRHIREASGFLRWDDGVPLRNYIKFHRICKERERLVRSAAKQETIIMSDNVDLGINRIVRAGSKWRLNASRKWWSVALAAAAVIGLLTVCGFRFIQLDGVGESLSTSNPSLQSLIDAQTTIDDGTPIVDWILSWKRSEVEETLHGAAGAFVLRIKVQTEESLVNSKDEPGFLLQHSLTLADKRKESLGTAVRQLDRLKQGSELRLIYENALVREKEQSDTWTQHYTPFDEAFLELPEASLVGRNARLEQFRKTWNQASYAKRADKFRELEEMRVITDAYFLEALRRKIDALMPCPELHDWECQATLAQHEVSAINGANAELSEACSEWSRLEDQRAAAQLRSKRFDGYRIVVRTTREFLDGGSLRALDHHLKTCQELNSSDLDYLSREVRVAVEERTAAVYKAAMDAIAALLLPENVETQFDLKTLSEVVSARNGVIAKAREVLPEPSKEASGLESIANTDTDRLRSASAHVARYGPFDRAFAELDHSEPAGKNARIVQFREKWPEVDFPDRSGVFGKLEVMRVFVNEYHLDRLKRAVDGLTPCPDPHDWACQATLAQHEVTAIVVATKELSDDSSERSKLENQHTDAQARAEKCEGYRMVSRTTRELLAGDSLQALDTYLKTCPELNSPDLEYLYKEVRAAVEERTAAAYKKAMDAIATLPLPKKFESKSELAIFNEAVLSRKGVIEVALADLPPNCDSARRLIDTISADSKPLAIKSQEIEFESAKREFDDEFKRSAGAEARVTLIKAFVGRFPPSAFPSRSTQIEAVQSMLPEQEQSAKIESLAARVGALEQSFPKGEPDKLSLHRTKCEDLLKELVPIDVVGYQALRTRLQEQLAAVKREIGDGSFRDCEECWKAFCATPGNLGLWERFKGRANVFLAGKSVPLDQKIQLTKQVTDGNGYIGRRTDFINAFKEFEKSVRSGREASDLWNRVVNGAQAAEDADTYNPNFHTGIEYKFDREYIDCVRYVLRVNAGVHVSATLMWFDVSNTPLDETTQVELVAKLNCSGKTISTKSMYDLPSKGDVRGTAGDFEEQLDLKIVDELRGTLTELDEWSLDPHEETNFSVAAYKVFMEAARNGVSEQTITCTPHAARLKIAFRGLPIKPTFSNEVKK